jgi:hypothetical protein
MLHGDSPTLRKENAKPHIHSSRYFKSGVFCSQNCLIRRIDQIQPYIIHMNYTFPKIQNSEVNIVQNLIKKIWCVKFQNIGL